MSYGYAPRPPKMARWEFGNPDGSSTIYDMGLWSPGSDSWSKTDSVRRKKPATLWDNPTPNGTHVRQKLYKGPLNFTYPTGGGSFLRWIDWDPANWASVGYNGHTPNPDWQTKLRLAIKDQKVNLAQTFAEFGQAQKMFANNATIIAKSLSSLRRGDYKNVFRLLGIPRKQLRGTISNRWLELQYGWMPLLSDLHGLVEEVQAGFERPRTRKINVRVKEEDSGSSESGLISPFNVRPVMDWNSSTVVKVVVYLRQDSSTASRLGVTNPINLAWELLPYSFVIDWFIPIGNWLNSLDAMIGYQGITGTVTTKSKYVATMQWCGQTYLYETYSRAVINGVPDAPLPTWKPSLGWKQVANALALLSQLKR